MNIFSRSVPWYHFWDTQSGLLGGCTMGLIVDIIFFSVYYLVK